MIEQKHVGQRNENESTLRNHIRELEEICFGLHKRIIPASVKAANMERYYVIDLSDKLTKETVDCGASANTQLFYNAFFKVAIFYLLAMCNEDDQILLSLIKLAQTLDDGDRRPISDTVFGILIGDINFETLNAKDKEYAKECLTHYEDLKKYYVSELDPGIFFETVDNGVKKYIDRHGYSCLDSEKKYLEVMRILREACWEAYFTIYQRWEDE